MKQQKGITLIALVITIVILLILAAVTITLSLGDGGLADKAVEGRDNYNAAMESEQKIENTALNYIDEHVE